MIHETRADRSQQMQEKKLSCIGHVLPDLDTEPGSHCSPNATCQLVFMLNHYHWLHTYVDVGVINSHVATQAAELYYPDRRLSASVSICCCFFIVSVCTVGQSMFPSGLHHTNEEEKSRYRMNTEAPSALQSHLFDTQR